MKKKKEVVIKKQGLANYGSLNKSQLSFFFVNFQQSFIGTVMPTVTLYIFAFREELVILTDTV